MPTQRIISDVYVDCEREARPALITPTAAFEARFMWPLSSVQAMAHSTDLELITPDQSARLAESVYPNGYLPPFPAFP